MYFFYNKKNIEQIKEENKFKCFFLIVEKVNGVKVGWHQTVRWRAIESVA